MRQKIILALLLFLLLAPLPGSQLRLPPPDRSGTLRAVPVDGVAAGLRLGALTLDEAWDLVSPDSRMGGISSMALMAPRRFLMVTDTGQQVQFDLTRGGTIQNLRREDLPALRRGMVSKRYLDAEALTRDPQTGVYWVALEGIAQVWRFTPTGERSARMRQPAMFKWPANGGPESLALLPDGRFIALSERALRGGKSEGLIIAGDPAVPQSPYFRFTYDSQGQGSPTDVTALPDGRILILHRKLGLSPVFTTSLAIADPRELKSGERLTSRPIARIDHAQLAENYEGLAIEQSGANLWLWLVSDNNQNDWQRSRLLRLRINPALLQAAKRAAPSPARPLHPNRSVPN